MLIYLQLSFQILSQSQQSRAVPPDEVLEISYKGFNTVKKECCISFLSKLNKGVQAAHSKESLKNI